MILAHCTQEAQESSAKSWIEPIMLDQYLINQSASSASFPRIGGGRPTHQCGPPHCHLGLPRPSSGQLTATLCVPTPLLKYCYPLYFASNHGYTHPSPCHHPSQSLIFWPALLPSTHESTKICWIRYDKMTHLPTPHNSFGRP